MAENQMSEKAHELARILFVDQPGQANDVVVEIIARYLNEFRQSGVDEATKELTNRLGESNLKLLAASTAGDMLRKDKNNLLDESIQAQLTIKELKQDLDEYKRVAEILDNKQLELRKENERLRKEAWTFGDAHCCEKHPNTPWEHRLENGEWCSGPGIPDIQGRITIKSLQLRVDALREALKKLLTEASAIHGDDLADSRTIEMARQALNPASKEEGK